MADQLIAVEKRWLTVGDLLPRENYVLAAYKAANARGGYWRRTALFTTPHGMLMLEWGRYGWDHRWLEDPLPLDLPRIGEE